MPVSQIQVKSREITQFSATSNEGEIDIQGNYVVSVQYTGFVPTPSSSFNVNSVKHSSSDTTILSEKSKSIGRLSPGQSVKLTIPFTLTGNESDLEELASAGCSGDLLQLKTTERFVGLLLLSTVGETVSVPSSPSDCNIGNDESQEDNDESQEDNDQASDEDNTNEPEENEPGVPYAVQVNGPREINVDSQAEWTAVPIEISNSEVYYEFEMGDNTEYSVGNALVGPNRTLSGENSVTHTYTTSGEYTISVTMFDYDTNEELASNTYVVEAMSSDNNTEDTENNRAAIANIQGPEQVTVGETGTWRITVNNGSGRVNWGDGDGLQNQSSGSVRHTYDSPDTYNITVTSQVTSNNGSSSAMDSIQVEVNEEGQEDEQDNNQQQDDINTDLLRRHDFKNDGVIDEDEAQFAQTRNERNQLVRDQATIIITEYNRGTEFEPLRESNVNDAGSFLEVYNAHADFLREHDTDNTGYLTTFELTQAINDADEQNDPDKEALVQYIMDQQTGETEEDRNRVRFPATEDEAMFVRKNITLLAEADNNNNGMLETAEVTELITEHNRDGANSAYTDGQVQGVINRNQNDGINFGPNLDQHPLVGEFNANYDSGGAQTSTSITSQDIQYKIPSMDEI